MAWIQTGGVVAFAAAVLIWLRDYKREVAPVFAELVATMKDVKTTLAALLERERARAERLAAQDAVARRSAADAGVVAETFGEDTHPIATIPRRQTPAGGYSIQRPRTRGDHER